jgi:hypothetical protein
MAKQRNPKPSVKNNPSAATIQSDESSFVVVTSAGETWDVTREDAFTVGNNAKVNTPWSMFSGKMGKVVSTTTGEEGRTLYAVEFSFYPDGPIWFAEKELKKVEVASGEAEANNTPY